jgi:glycosyltransferase involved in cell wall biosynthesis
MSLLISVIICTRNRAARLELALQSIAKQQNIDTSNYEVVVVDNASTDSTRHLVESWMGTLNLRYFLESKIGLSSARNTGLAKAQGHYVAYLDDDAIASEGWLAQVPIAFDCGGPDVACVGGKIIPIWGAWGEPKPNWLPEQLTAYVGALDYSSIPRRFASPAGPHGGNVVFRREVLLQIGGFSTQLGRREGTLLSNEELLVFRRLRALNFGIYYDPRLCVYHYIDPGRLTKEWFRRRAYWQGVSNAILDIQSDAGRVRISLKSIKRAAYIGRNLVEYVTMSFAGNEAEAFKATCGALEKIGYFVHGWHGGVMPRGLLNSG